MSRIHEALKKAAEERSAQLAAGLETGVVEVTGELRRPITQGPGIAQPTAAPRVPTGDDQDVPFHYEELIKRCAQVEWRLDPVSSVFLNSKPAEGCPERLRTLPSRLYTIPTTSKP